MLNYNLPFDFLKVINVYSYVNNKHIVVISIIKFYNSENKLQIIKKIIIHSSYNLY